jgi:sugar lactone lactonase YvrE/ketosteroid isomerase-like protein
MKISALALTVALTCLVLLGCGEHVAQPQPLEPAEAAAPELGATGNPADSQDLRASQAQPFEQVALFPADGSLIRPEDGVLLADGTLLVADQVQGLVALDPTGAKRPFGDFSAAGFVHQPPARSAGPNGVALEPDGVHVLVADIFTGAIYRVDSQSERVELAHQHEFGANSARRDSSGALWFTQSTENSGPDSEARMFAAVDMRPSDGALFRVAPAAGTATGPVAERKLSGLEFANGLAIDEARGQIYIAETMADRIIGFRLDVETGELSDRRVVASLPTPDNIELDAAGRLWVASPIANALLLVDPESGEWSTAFHPQTAEHARLMAEWKRRGEKGEARLELIGPDMWSPLPGLLTGMILTTEGGPIYLSGLGNALVKIGPTGRTDPDLGELRKLIEAKNERFTRAHVTGDRATIDAMFTDDAKVLPPNADPVIGRAAIDQLTAEFIAYGITEFSEETTDFYGNGQLLIDQGNYTMVYGPDNTVEKGKYLNVWKQVDGEWKIYSNIWSANAPESSP